MTNGPTPDDPPGAAQGPPPHRLQPPRRLQPLAPQRPKGSPLIKLFLVCLLGVGVYGGYYGYCSYKVSARRYAMAREAQDLHQALMRLTRNIGPEDMRQVVMKMATAARVQVAPQDIQVVIEPMNDESMRRLPTIAQTAMGMATKIPGEKRPTWVVGFKARFFAKHGLAKRHFELERYTWSQWVAETTE